MASHGQLCPWLAVKRDCGVFLGTPQSRSLGAVLPAKGENAWQNPDDGFELGRWQDLIRLGADLAADNPQEMQNIQNDELRERVQFVMLTDTEGRSPPTMRTGM